MAETKSDPNPAPGTTRRHFLRRGSALGLASVLPAGALTGCGADSGHAAAPAPASDGALAPTARRRLGRTGIEIPPVSFGTFSLRDGGEDVVREALDLGITHFDTADSYGDREGESEAALGRALKGQRHRVTLTTKTGAPADARAEDLMRGLDASLGRLGTDHVDLYLNHALDDFDRLRSPGWRTFVDQAKRAGKIRAAGISGHGPSLVPVLEEAIETDWLDVVLVAYNYVQSPSYLSEAKLALQRMTGRLDWVSLQPELPALLDRARERDIGS